MYIVYSHIIGLLFWIILLEELGVSSAVQYSKRPTKRIIVCESLFTLRYYIEYDDYDYHADV